MTRLERRRRNRQARILYITFLLTLAAMLVLTIHTAAETTGIPPTEQIKAAMSDSELPAEDKPETDENVLIEAALLARANRIDNCTVSHYAVCVECCGKTDGITYSGITATPYVSVAVDPALIPLGSDVLVDYGDGEIHYYRADDTGSGVTGAHIDLCVGSYDEAVQLGVRTATVWYVPPVEVDKQ